MSQVLSYAYIKNERILVSFRVCVAVSGVHYVKPASFINDNMRKIITEKEGLSTAKNPLYNFNKNY